MIQGPIVIDIGAGSGIFAKKLFSYMGHIEHIIATEIASRPPKNTHPKIDFRLHPSSNPIAIPAEPDTANTALFINVLHHVPPEQTKEILDRTYSILKKNGTIIILEDSFSELLPPIYDAPPLIKLFISFPIEERLKIFQFMDWFSTRVMEGVHGMPYPFNYKSVESWGEILHTSGFTNITYKFLGITPGSFHAISKGLIVATKK